MSEAQKSGATSMPPSLRAEDINRYLDERAPDTKCPSCGSDRLAILSNPDDTVMTGFSLLLGGKARFPVFVQVCTNCGFSFHFAVQRVLDWLEKRKSEE